MQSRVKVLEAQLKEQEARYTAAREDHVQANIIKDEVAHIEARLEYARKRAQELVLRSTGDTVKYIYIPTVTASRSATSSWSTSAVRR